MFSEFLKEEQILCTYFKDITTNHCALHFNLMFFYISIGEYLIFHSNIVSFMQYKPQHPSIKIHNFLKAGC